MHKTCEKGIFAMKKHISFIELTNTPEFFFFLFVNFLTAILKFYIVIKNGLNKFISTCDLKIMTEFILKHIQGRPLVFCLLCF